MPLPRFVSHFAFESATVWGVNSCGLNSSAVKDKGASNIRKGKTSDPRKSGLPSQRISHRWEDRTDYDADLVPNNSR